MKDKITKTTTVIFDCFGVLYADTMTVLLDTCKNQSQRQAVQDLCKASDRGYISASELTSQLSEITKITQGELQKILVQAMHRNHAVFDYAWQIKNAGYKLGVLSNFGRDAIDRLFTSKEKTELFDSIIASGDIGVSKPDIEAYEIALNRLNSTAKHTVFIDDSLQNVEVARQIGMYGVQFTSLSSTRAHLEGVINA